MSEKSLRVKLLFVDEGEYREETVVLPATSADAHDRLIDFIREDPLVLKYLHVDLDRLCAAHRVDD